MKLACFAPGLRRSRMISVQRKLVVTKAALAVASLLCVVSLATAHRLPGSLSTIKLNPRAGVVEVIHRLHNHDAEEALVVARNDRTLSIDSLAGRAELALYVEEKFIVANVAAGRVGAPLALEIVGAELSGDYVLVYQELKGSLPREIAVRDDIFRDVFPGQVNHVNIAAGGDVRSLVFQDDDEWQTTSLE